MIPSELVKDSDLLLMALLFAHHEGQISLLKSPASGSNPAVLAAVDLSHQP